MVSDKGMEFSDGSEGGYLLPAPEVDAYGFCTMCGVEEKWHTGPDGTVSVRDFHRSALGGFVRFIDEVEEG